MKRGKLEQHLREQGCHFSHHGGKHDVWINPSTGKDAPLPRHNDIKKWTARGICKVLGVRSPPGSSLRSEEGTRQSASILRNREMLAAVRIGGRWISKPLSEWRGGDRRQAKDSP